ncbi:RnfABCDGE type electron transport complex subunit B [Halalkaliarchaeum sp. AArc-GB]|uniref:RnfABCDGE type electron transport complex subunit B n=1 Tax=Halalkaliarchaeum sp. AArc-GB TaxID=3074078 RepID=UPI002859CB44|nr:RnfABCDGE type electron transport complex subunit B [Halalkaliarchaeum sp. AArc-GB]MDR5673071.1 RnfABCDGE type electron transport complex subunit B [Halalkaliarchaeum sp. AArc-GB]
MSVDRVDPLGTGRTATERVDADVLVVGGGIAGIQSSLDLADSGAEVVLVERSPSIGGKMAALDKNFPTLDCSICIEGPVMSDAIEHDNIEVLTLAELTDLSGAAGDFTADVYQAPRFVGDECTRCDDCVEACPEYAPNEFDEGMGSRTAIFTPFEQAEPGPYVVDLDTCMNDPPNRMPCDRCQRACGPDCIDFEMTPTEYEIDVSSVIVATGFDLLNPEVIDEYGYGEHPDVLTSMEYERMLDAAGPTEGHIVRPSDGEHPEDVLFVYCVGSRDQRHCEYCSRVCCMYSNKQAIQSVDHGVDDVTALYMDMRAFGKGFDDFYDRAREEADVDYVRGRPAAVDTDGDSPVVRYEDADAGEVREEAYDMVVLAPALIPSDGTPDLAARLGVEVDDDGFFATTEAGGDMTETTRNGVYAAGAATGPKDIPDSVAEASGAASRALSHVEERTWPEPVDVEPIDATGEERVGVFVCHCGSNIAGTIDVEEVADWAEDLPNVEYTEDLLFACAGNTQEHITETVKEHELNRVVVASCSPKTHGPTFERVIAEAGLNKYLLEMANVRNHNSWVHDDERSATEKAKDMVKMAVDKAAFLTPLEEIEQPVEQTGVVIGGGIAGMSAAVSMAESGNEVHLIEREAELGGQLRHLEELHPGGRDADELLERRKRQLQETGVVVHTDTEVEGVSGHVGNFAINLDSGETVDAGAVVLATGASPYEPEEFGYDDNPEVITNRELDARLADGGVDADRVTFVGCVGSRDGDRGCSRYCCSSIVGQANQLAADGATVDVVNKDVRTFTRGGEEAYRAAQKQGVRFFRYDQDTPAGEALSYDAEAGELSFHERTLDREVVLEPDLIVLATGLRSNGADEEGDVASQLTVTRDEEQFLLESHPKLGPVEASVGGVFMAGTAQGPKGVRDAVDGALGTAAKADALLSKEEITQEPLAAQIDPETCIGCTRCAEVCPYNAVEGEAQSVHSVIEAACMGCGTCASACPTDSITMPGFTDEQIKAQISAALETNPEEKVLTFACNWCSYAGADQAGIEKRSYPESIRIVRTMCSGRVDEEFVDHAFEEGAGAVLVTGCHIGDCHYIDANTYTEERVNRWQNKLDEEDEGRLQLEWISAAEGERFAAKATEMDEVVREFVADRVRADGGCCGDCDADSTQGGDRQ